MGAALGGPPCGRTDGLVPAARPQFPRACPGVLGPRRLPRPQPAVRGRRGCCCRPGPPLRAPPRPAREPRALPGLPAVTCSSGLPARPLGSADRGPAARTPPSAPALPRRLRDDAPAHEPPGPFPGPLLGRTGRPPACPPTAPWVQSSSAAQRTPRSACISPKPSPGVTLRNTLRFKASDLAASEPTPPGTIQRPPYFREPPDHGHT